MYNRNQYLYLYLFDIVCGAFLVYLISTSSIEKVGGGWVYIPICGFLVGLLVRYYPNLSKPLTMIATFILFLSFYNYVMQFESISKSVFIGTNVSNLVISYFIYVAIGYPFEIKALTNELMTDEVRNLCGYVFERLWRAIILVYGLIIGGFLVGVNSQNSRALLFIVSLFPLYLAAGMCLLYVDLKSMPHNYLNYFRKVSILTDLNRLITRKHMQLTVILLFITLIMGLGVTSFRSQCGIFSMSFISMIAVVFVSWRIWKEAIITEITEIDLKSVPDNRDMKDRIKFALLVSFIFAVNIFMLIAVDRTL